MKQLIALILITTLFTSFRSSPPAGDVPFTTLQARRGLPVFFEKLKNGKPVTIAYLGGSITEAPGYRIQTEDYFKSAYPASAIKTVAAGVGGTGSYLGVFRLGQDVLSQKPDLVFIEFAVNDAKGDSIKVCNAVEGIIRQIRKANNKTDICFLYTIYEPMLADYNAGKVPSSIRYMERIAAYYSLPSVNLGPEVMNRLNHGELIFKADKNSDQAGKLIFTNDATHPTTEGHRVYTETIIAALKQLETIPGKHPKLQPACYPDNLQYTTMISPRAATYYGSWKSGAALPELKTFLKSFPDLIYTDNPSDSLVIRFSGRQFGIGDVMGPSSGTALIQVDGRKVIRKRFDEFSNFYRRSFFFIDSLADGPHILSIKLDATPMDKLKMLRPGNPGDLARYKRYELYIGNMMLSKKK